MKYYTILFLTLLLTNSLVYAQTDDSEDDEESFHQQLNPGEISQKKGYTLEPIDVQRFDEKKWEEIVGGRDYVEDQAKAKKKKQDGSQFSESSKGDKRIKGDGEDDSEMSDSTASSPIQSLILTIVVYGLAIAIIGYILFMIVRNTSFKSNRKIPKSDLPGHPTVVEDIKELEIDRLLREAMTSGNYRLVIRMYFLGLLQKLDEDGFIIWKKDKTNRDYLSELFSKAHFFEEVKSLTFAYEEVWYGDHNLHTHTYEEIILSFKKINEKLKTSHTRETR